jgi:hypothetical protein
MFRATVASTHCGAWPEVARTQEANLRAGMLVVNLPGYVAPGSDVCLGFDMEDGTQGELRGRIARRLSPSLCQVVLAGARSPVGGRSLRAPTGRIAARVDLHRFEALTDSQRAAAALHADLPLRQMILRSPRYKPLHVAVLRNPRLTMEEVEAATTLPHLDRDTLAEVGGRALFVQSQAVLHNLVRHPRTPSSLAVALAARLDFSHTQRLTRGGGHLAKPVLEALRRRLGSFSQR